MAEVNGNVTEPDERVLRSNCDIDYVSYGFHL